jgi:hypothetical protein
VVEVRPGLRQRLGGPEELLHDQQALALQRHPRGRQRRVGARVGAQDELAIIARVGRGLGRVDRDRRRLDAQEAPEPAAHQLAHHPPERVRQRHHDRGPVGGVLGGLVRVRQTT